MKQVNCRVSDEVFQALEDKAREQNLTVPAFVRSMLVESFSVSNSSPGISVIPTDDEKVRLWIYIRKHEKALLQANADLHKWSLSRESVFRINSTLLNDKGDVCFYPEEIKALRETKTAINTLGRNIHHIITGARHVAINDESFRLEIAELLSLMKNQKEELDNLIDSVVNRWNI
ncbi:hypothetical protein [Aeromonas salmonicida]|uniref:hypothetical protein n=1 Tax=Aeromonas salmonicida TaxID=645 RepID=UPI0030B28E04